MSLYLLHNGLLPSDLEIWLNVTEETGFYQLITCHVTRGCDWASVSQVHLLLSSWTSSGGEKSFRFPLTYSRIWSDPSFSPHKLRMQIRGRVGIFWCFLCTQAQQSCSWIQGEAGWRSHVLRVTHTHRRFLSFTISSEMRYYWTIAVASGQPGGFAHRRN